MGGPLGDGGSCRVTVDIDAATDGGSNEGGGTNEAGEDGNVSSGGCDSKTKDGDCRLGRCDGSSGHGSGGSTGESDDGGNRPG